MRTHEGSLQPNVRAASRDKTVINQAGIQKTNRTHANPQPRPLTIARWPWELVESGISFVPGRRQRSERGEYNRENEW